MVRNLACCKWQMTRLQNEQDKEKFISPPVRGQPSPNEQYRLLSSCLSYVVGLLQWSQNNYEPGELLTKSGGRAIAPPPPFTYAPVSLLVAQPIWPSGCPMWAQKRAKNTKNAFLALFWAYIGHPDGHIGWATLMLFTSIYPTNPRTNL